MKPPTPPLSLEINLSFFLSLALGWELGRVTGLDALSALFALFWHELGHLLLLRLCRIPIRRIRLSAAGIRIDPAPGLYPPLKIALPILGGSLFSLSMAALMLFCQLPDGYLHLAIGAFSLLPLPGLDGGELTALIFTRSPRYIAPPHSRSSRRTARHTTPHTPRKG